MTARATAITGRCCVGRNLLAGPFRKMQRRFSGKQRNEQTNRRVREMSETTQSAGAQGGFKPKKSVALSGVPAGNTALCTVGKTGNDLHYRGYDILDIADNAEFEEIAFLLVHGKLPNVAELAAYKRKLKALRGIPMDVQDIL